MGKNFAIFFTLLLCELALMINARKLKPDFRSGTRFNKRPNIIFILVDDMDKELGSPNVMKQTKKILRQEGADFVNAFVTSPMCCPSRTSILTGKYAHNHHTFTNNWNCSSLSWRRTHEKRTYARYLELAGYVTGHFGKYLNEYDGSWVPVGWKRWEGLLHNSKFYNYTLRHNTYKERHKMSYEHDYFTDLITNRSISFIRRTIATRPDSPFLAVLSHSAPHGPETAAPQYSNAFPYAKAPRLPNWNFVSQDKQWIVRKTQSMDAQKIAFVDLLHRRRLQTLLSVDDSVARIFSTLQSLGIVNETYIFFTSDHGYHLGQFALVKGKSMPFESDIRVPFYVRGPSIPKNIRMKEMILNLDIAPTFLDIAGVNTPKDMDGSSIMKLFRKSRDGRRSKRRMHVQWRDTFLIERSRGWRRTKNFLGGNSRNKTQGGKDRKMPKHTFEGKSRNRTLARKERKMTLLEKLCSDPKHHSPCQPKQLWECITVDGRPRLRKCRRTTTHPTNPPTPPTTPVKMCVCMKPRPGHENQDGILPDDDEWLEDDLDFFSAKELRRRSKRSRLDLNKRSRRKRNEFNARRYYKELARAQRKQNRRSKSKMLLRPPGTVTRTRLNATEGQTDRYDYAGVQEVVEEKLGKLKEKIWEARMRLGALRDRRKKLLLISARDKLIEYPCPCSDGSSTRPERTTAASSREGGENGEDFDIDDEAGSPISPPRRRNKQPKAVLRKTDLKKKKVKVSLRRSYCSSPGMNCFYQTNDHWKLPPLWTGGDFCFCPNAANNSYWCLRTINATHNFLYCEFVTHFLEFFDLNQDPYQLYNVIHRVDPAVLSELHEQLHRMIACKGDDCHHYYGKKYTDVTATYEPVTTTPSPSASASTASTTTKTTDGESFVKSEENNVVLNEKNTIIFPTAYSNHTDQLPSPSPTEIPPEVVNIRSEGFATTSQRPVDSSETTKWSEVLSLTTMPSTEGVRNSSESAVSTERSAVETSENGKTTPSVFPFTTTVPTKAKAETESITLTPTKGKSSKRRKEKTTLENGGGEAEGNGEKQKSKGLKKAKKSKNKSAKTSLLLPTKSAFPSGAKSVAEISENRTKIGTKSETVRPESGEKENTTEGNQPPTEIPRKRNKKPSGKRLNRNSKRRTKKPTKFPKTSPTSKRGESGGEDPTLMEGGDGFRNEQGHSPSNP